MRKNLRYLILLLILLFVAINEALNKTRSTSWENPLWVRIYAISGDGRDATEKHLGPTLPSMFVAEAGGKIVGVTTLEVELGRDRRHVVGRGELREPALVGRLPAGGDDRENAQDHQRDGHVRRALVGVVVLLLVTRLALPGERLLS